MRIERDMTETVRLATVALVFHVWLASTADAAGLEPGELNDPLDLSELLKVDFWQYKLHLATMMMSLPCALHT